MDDLISRQAAIDALQKAIPDNPLANEYTQGITVGLSLAERIIYVVPSAQPDLSSYSDKLWRNAYERGKAEAQAEIIACGDCKHWICHDRRCGYWNHGVKPLDWCCHAERKE